MVFFGLFWSGMTLLFDGFILVPIARQIKALSFQSTEGTILSSQVKQGSSENGSVYGVSISYAYVVDGRDFDGDRYRYDRSSSSDSDWAVSVVRNNPAGKKVRVFYDPHDPQDSLLATGIQGSDLFLAAFMTPFNAVMLWIWRSGWMLWWRKRKKPVAGRIKLIREPRRTRARLTTISSLSVMIGTMAGLAFASIFAVGFGNGFHPPLPMMIVTWGLILSGGILAGIYHLVRVRAGKYDLIIDDLENYLELPLTHGRKRRQRVPFENITDLRLKIITKPGNEGDTVTIYAPTLFLSGGEPDSQCFVEWRDEKQARLFTEWLRGKLPNSMPAKKEQIFKVPIFCKTPYQT